MIPVTTVFPKSSRKYNRCRNLNISGFFMNFTPIFNKRIFYNHNIGKEERESGTLVKECKQFKFLAKLSVVTFLCFLKHCNICVKVCSLCICCPINTRKHLVLFVSSPICTCNTHKLKSFKRFRTHKVRSCTKVCKITLFIKRNNSVLRKISDKLNFIRLFFFLHKLDSLCSGKFKSFKRNILFNNFLHFFFYFFKLFVCKSLFSVKIIVKTIVN
ncbi:hypothetical protein SDC9_92209 [bioreactor metagenome]|uniref:Uncharacterized protein n=1 Tax=bioreactor metagenome TaxID=1076179 RepID=A0A644ZXH4_9ZZZZ